MLRKYYTGSLIFTAICLVIGAWLGWQSTGTVQGTLGILWIVAVLGVLEVSLSFDNAVVNATVLEDMDEVWRRRFLTWGILIAVFGMRIVFPLAIVAIAASLGPIEAIKLAATNPLEYERIVSGAHVGVSGFGGAFLAMVGLTFFLDEDKDAHWIAPIERPIASLSKVSGLALGLVLAALYFISRTISPDDAMTFIVSGIFGLLTYIAVQAVGALLEQESEEEPTEALGGRAPGEVTAAATGVVVKSGLASFLYLEVLDASFSFDGVIGAFALSNNLFIIALGLGIGAMFVRSMTIMLVDKGTLNEYRYLEHGAFYAILALAAIMLLAVRFHIPETITGLIGAGLIGVSFLASLRANKRDAANGVDADTGSNTRDPIAPTGERLSL